MQKIYCFLMVLLSLELSAQKPYLIPQPQKEKFDGKNIHLHQFQGILIKDSSLQNLADQLKIQLDTKNWSLPILSGKTVLHAPMILLEIDTTLLPQQKKGSYKLNIAKASIKIQSNTEEGIRNGIQTLVQLAVSQNLPICQIEDWPAFEWRGFMIDVGRNYVPMKQLKELIDKMAFYKLNVFHFHATEDIAWRFEIQQYPQLTSAASMLRNQGEFYSVAEIKELIKYCKDRQIKFIPEIDMPGHSAAFKRAMKVDMQSDEGMQILKNILHEICTTYDIEYLHIGSDEVRIVNQSFIPNISRYVQSMGKKIIGWQPGGNYINYTIRQLWLDDLGKVSGDAQIQYIDSRHLYINHLDPLESVTSFYNRQISNKEKGDSNAIGAIVCLWNDRKVSKASDLFIMNPVYPSIMAFAERIWRGGGTKGWIANISDGDVNGFKEFESRLLFHQKTYFQQLPFPYAEQSKMVWTLIGPYFNQGDLSAKFAPEEPSSVNSKFENTITTIGGTVVLRHWWAPLIKAAIPNPKDSSTWYATTKIWSNQNRLAKFWIGFINFSRSQATDTAPASYWDEKNSMVWVNGQLIPAPKWKNAGQKGNSELPLVDENYESRVPTEIPLQKGWNTVLLKCPVGSFKGKNGQNPVKWMFSFVEAPNGF